MARSRCDGDKNVGELLRPFAAKQMRCYPVSNRVNQVQNDDPECATPVALELSSQDRFLF